MIPYLKLATQDKKATGFIWRGIPAVLMAFTAAAIPPAMAADPNDDSGFVVRSVKTSDLDLSTPEGLHALQHRLRLAARDVCKDAIGADANDDADFRECFHASLADATKQANQIVASAKSKTMVATTSAK